MNRHFVVLVVAFSALAAGSPGQARAAFLLDSGLPTSSGALTVANNSQATQFVAQQFTLASSSQVTTIEAYLLGGFGNASIQMDLSTAIGPSATAANLIGSYTLADPSTSSYVAANVNRLLAAGTYYLSFSAATGSPGGAIFYGAPNVLGTTYVGPPNASLPIASGFFSLPSSSEIGLRVSGTPSAVPEPSSLAMCGIAGAVGLVVARVRRKRAAG